MANSSVGEVPKVASPRAQLIALLKLNLLAARREKSYILGGVLIPLLMIAIAVGMSLAFQGNIPEVDIGSEISIPIIARFANISSDASYPYVTGSPEIQSTWINTLQTPLIRSLDSTGDGTFQFTRYDSLPELADNLVTRVQKQREQGITNATGSPGLGFKVSSLKQSGSNAVDFGFALLYDSKKRFGAPVALNAMNMAAQSIVADGSSSSNQNARPVVLQPTLRTFPAQPRERFFVAAVIVPVFLTYGFSFLTSLFAGTIVHEKEFGHRGHLESMGVGPRVYILASFIRDMFVSLIPTISATIILTAARLPIVIEGNILPWIFCMLFSAAPLVGMSYLVANIFQRSANVTSTLSIVMAMVVFVPYFIVQFVVDNNVSIAAVCVTTIFLPTFGMERTFTALSLDAVTANGYSAADTFNINRRVFPALLSLVGSTIFYWALELYVDQRLRTGQGKKDSFISRLKRWFVQRLQRRKKHAEAHSSAATARNDDEEAKNEMRRLQRGEDPYDGKEDAVRLLGLKKVFSTRLGDKTVLDEIWMATRTTECFGYLGPNGAGKTTTLKILTGQLDPTEGTATICGLPISPYHKDIHALLGVCPQYDILWQQLTAREHLRCFAMIKGVPNPEIEAAVDEIIFDLDLNEVADRPCGGYSGGNKRRLSLGIACIGRPRVIFLDEPTTGVDVGVRRKIWECIRRIKQTACVVLTTHSMEEAEALCDRIAVMVNGAVQAIGTPQRLKNVYGAGYKVLVKTKTPAGTLEVLERLRVQVAAKPVQILGCHLEAECERDNSNDNGNGTVANEAGMLARIFQVLEDARQECGVVDYSVGQTTLGQVFVSFAERQITV